MLMHIDIDIAHKRSFGLNRVYCTALSVGACCKGDTYAHTLEHGVELGLKKDGTFVRIVYMADYCLPLDLSCRNYEWKRAVNRKDHSFLAVPTYLRSIVHHPTHYHHHTTSPLPSTTQ